MKMINIKEDNIHNIKMDFFISDKNITEFINDLKKYGDVLKISSSSKYIIGNHYAKNTKSRELRYELSYEKILELLNKNEAQTTKQIYNKCFVKEIAYKTTYRILIKMSLDGLIESRKVIGGIEGTKTYWRIKK